MQRRASVLIHIQCMFIRGSSVSELELHNPSFSIRPRMNNRDSLGR
jgi:hypothetical protein